MPLLKKILVTRLEIADEINKSGYTVNRCIKELKELNILKYKTNDKIGKWIINS